MPPMEVEKTGYGMGKRDFAAANCVRVFLGKDAALTDGPNGTVIKLECNLDDMTPEGIGSVIARLFEEGALDAFSTPIYMKKNRPAVLLSCLCRPEDADRLAVFLLRETTTFGVRRVIYDRYMLERSFVPIETAYGAVTVKRGRGYGVEKAKPEYEDIVRCAGKAGVSFEAAYRAALREL